jgi:hypothetical protein
LYTKTGNTTVSILKCFYEVINFHRYPYVTTITYF